MNLALKSAVTAVVLSLPSAARADEDTKSSTSPKLSKQDEQFLESLIKDFLFNPRSAQRVSVPVTVRTVWASASTTIDYGWLVEEKNKPPRIYSTDGAILRPTDAAKITRIDFVAACRSAYSPPKTKKDESESWFRRHELIGDGDLAAAAWFLRLGEKELAARALREARKRTNRDGEVMTDQGLVEALRADLAWWAFAGAVHAFMVRADDEALAFAEHLVSVHPKQVEKDYAQAKDIVADLKRRQKIGTFGKAPGKRPDDFAKWDARRKAEYLIASLDEVDARQWGQPGGVELPSDERVKLLIELGDDAVPALIEALGKDERLTRSVHFWRDFARSRTVLAVREPVVVALMSILGVTVFEPGATGDNFTARGAEAAKKAAERIRAYWKKYGHLPFDERMMTVLTDSKADPQMRREAAENLANFNDRPRRNTTIDLNIIGPKKAKVNPVIAKFKAPTVAEAMLKAMDEDLAAHDALKEKDSLHSYRRRKIEDHYLWLLIQLGDRRIANDCAGRSAKARTLHGRQLWALASHSLGESQPVRALAEDFIKGTLTLSKDENRSASSELHDCIAVLLDANIPQTARAMKAICDRKHPFYSLAAKAVLESGGFRDEKAWFAHPFCIDILIQELRNKEVTGSVYVVEKDTLWRKYKGGGEGNSIPTQLADAKARKEKAEERACDLAAKQLDRLLPGLPFYHPLARDAEKQLDQLIRIVEPFKGQFRRMTYRETDAIDLSPFDPVFIPNIRPLERAATADDVARGKAFFHLDGKGTLADLRLPAVGNLKAASTEKKKVLILQAEKGADNVLRYGVVGPGGFRVATEPELSDIKTLPQLGDDPPPKET